MPIFKIKNRQLTPIKERSFDLEKDLQKLAEENLDTLFNLKFVSSEFQIEGYAIDTLAFDPETKSFVILEYKKDKSFSVVDQGLHYLSLMLSHKADFILEINEKLGESFNKKSIDWSQSRVMFLARSFTPYQTGSTSFRDFPIELWQVSVYENDTADFNLVQAPKAVESITTVAKGTDVERIAKEVEEYSVKAHRSKGNPKIQELFDSLQDKILELDDRIIEKPVKTYIGYKTHGSNFVALRIRKDIIIASIRIDKPQNPGLTIKKVPPSAWDTTPLWQFNIKSRSDLRSAMDLIEQAYNYYEAKYTK